MAPAFVPASQAINPDRFGFVAEAKGRDAKPESDARAYAGSVTGATRQRRSDADPDSTKSHGIRN